MDLSLALESFLKVAFLLSTDRFSSSSIGASLIRSTIVTNDNPDLRYFPQDFPLRFKGTRCTRLRAEAY